MSVHIRPHTRTPIIHSHSGVYSFPFYRQIYAKAIPCRQCTENMCWDKVKDLSSLVSFLILFSLLSDRFFLVHPVNPCTIFSPFLVTFIIVHVWVVCCPGASGKELPWGIRGRGIIEDEQYLDENSFFQLVLFHSRVII